MSTKYSTVIIFIYKVTMASSITWTAPLMPAAILREQEIAGGLLLFGKLNLKSGFFSKRGEKHTSRMHYGPVAYRKLLVARFA